MKKIFIAIAIIVALLAAGMFALQKWGQSLNTYDNFTACLKQNNIVMFWASWCPECAKQKRIFERGSKKIPYFECSPNGQYNPQDKECSARLILSYPTWQFDEQYLATLPDSTWDTLVEQYESTREAIEANLAEWEESPLEMLTWETNFEKLQSINPQNWLTVYNQWRISGRRSLEEIALYGNCENALALDTIKN